MQSNCHVLLLVSHADSILNFRGQLIQDMMKAGHTVTVAAPDVSSTLASSLQAMGVNVEETPMARTGLNPFKDLAYCRTLFKLCKKSKPDIVLTYTIKPNIWGAFAASKAGVRSVAMVTGLGYAFTDTGIFQQRIIRRIATLLYRASTKRNSLVIFLNPDDRSDFIAAGCIADKSKVRMVNGEGVDTSYYLPTPLPEEPVFLMISRLLVNKGVREYGTAAVAMKRKLPQCRFLLVGYMDEGPDGIAQSELDAWVAGGLEYLGPTSDVRPFISNSSVYVLPSYREGLPRSVLEALSMGRPVITSDTPGCRETVIEGQNGFLVAVANVDALCQKIKVLAQDADLRVKMGAKGRQIATHKFDVNLVNRTLMNHLGLSN